MRNIIAALVLLVLIGAALGFSLSKGLDDSATAAPLISRTVVIAENLAIEPPFQSVTTPFLATDDCGKVVVLVDATANMTIRAQPSVENGAIDSFAFTGSTSSKVIGQSVTFFGDFLIAPEMAIQFERSNTAVTDTINKAWLFCSHN